MGERLDSLIGLLYDNFRYYDPLTGRFVRSDTVQDNANGMDPYAYVGDNPETRNDPSGHCWPWCTAILGAVVGAAIGVGVTLVSDAVQHKAPSWGEVAQSAVAGAVSGAIVGVTGPGAGLVSAIGIGAMSGAVGNVAGKLASNAITGQSLTNGLVGASIDGAIAGGLTAGLLKGGSLFLNRFADKALAGFTATLVDGVRSLTTKVGDFTGLSGANFSDVVSRIPSSARQLLWEDSPDIPEGGFKWRWGNTPTWRMEIHGPDLNPDLSSDSNAAQGWIYRVWRAHQYLDDAGNWLRDNVGNPNSPFYNPGA